MAFPSRRTVAAPQASSLFLALWLKGRATTTLKIERHRFGGRSRRRNSGGVVAIIILLRFLLPIITVLLLLYLSRKREFMADAGAVELTRDNMALAKALLKISDDHRVNKEKYKAVYHATPHEEIRREAYIFDPKQLGISLQQSMGAVFSTHPPLDARLRALGFKSSNMLT